MKKIIVPCDFSAVANEAVRFAGVIAKKSKGEVTLFHTIELPTLYDTSAVLAFEASYMRESREKAEAGLGKLAKKYLGESSKVTYDVKFGGLKTTLQNTVQRSKADLIVMGTHGASGIKEFVIGSKAEKVVRDSVIPVISVRKSVDQVKKIVFPVEPDLDQEELTMKVKALQEFFGASLHVVFINTPIMFQRDSETWPALEKFAKRFMLKNYTLNIFNDTSEEAGIIHFTDMTKGDMVAMRTHGRRGIAHLVTGSIAEDVVNHIKCPIWTFRME